MQTLIHYFLHLGFPLIIAYIGFRHQWKKAYILLLATMLVDADHLLAHPIFEPNRCSIGFHPLHSYYAIVVYIGLLFAPNPYRILGIGLVLHMFTDLLDCLFMFAECPHCHQNAPAHWLLRTITDMF